MERQFKAGDYVRFSSHARSSSREFPICVNSTMDECLFGEVFRVTNTFEQRVTQYGVTAPILYIEPCEHTTEKGSRGYVGWTYTDYMFEPVVVRSREIPDSFAPDFSLLFL